jgi:hypothetical protein
MSTQIDIARRRAAQGFGFIDYGDGNTSDSGGSGEYDIYEFPDDRPSGGNGGNDVPWTITAAPVIGIIGKTLSSIFGNQYQQPTYVPPRTQYQSPQQYQVPPPGYGYDSSGRLVEQGVGNIAKFITTNPLLVGAGVLGVILLFRQPPGRR